MEHTEEFYEFYRAKMLCLDALPNAAHYKLAQWEKEGKLSAVITQNIDGLHQKAGSKNVLELHGSVWRNYCVPVRPWGILCRRSSRARVYRTARAGELSSRMSFCTRNRWIKAF